jgi:signal transduction histidine kinase
MRAEDHQAANSGRAPGLIERFRADLAREGLSFWSASFSDREMETAYQTYLADAELPKIRMIGVAGVVVWYLFGILDALTIQGNLAEVLAIRCLISGPIVICLASMLMMDRFKRVAGPLVGAGMLVCSFAILWMIALMPKVGAPPYIIGILVIFAYSSCFNRISFPLAAAVYLATTIVYSAMLIFAGKFTRVDVISGIFFMQNIATIAVLTHYAQELRSRQIWRRNRQRALDAAYIEELLIEATAADQSKINFISILSHELRTPLHQIIGFSEIVKQRLDGAPKSETQGFVDDIRGSAHDLLSRIAKMLRYADATAGKIKYEPERVSVQDLVETVLIQAHDKATKQGVTLDTSGVAEADVYVDHPHTSYAIGHIIENAIKASKKDGRVLIRGEIRGEAYALEVQDHGVGMDAEQIRAAFAPFSQVEQVRTRSREGLGLGLTLAKKIFQDQQADLSIASVKGEGTTVSIRLPLPKTRPQAAAA